LARKWENDLDSRFRGNDKLTEMTRIVLNDIGGWFPPPKV